MSDTEPVDADGQQRPTMLQRAARAALPLLLFVVAWMLFAGMPGMTEMAISQTTYEDRCPDEFASTKKALDDSGLFPDPVETLTPLGYDGSDGSSYVRASANCELVYVSSFTSLTPQQARESMSANGWELVDGPPGDFSAVKEVDEREFTVTVAVAGADDRTPVTVRDTTPR